MIDIRRYRDTDWPALWRAIEPVFRAGETYPYPRDIDEGGAKRVWIDSPAVTMVAVDGAGALLGSYYLKPNQPGLGSHVANAGYIVSEAARGRGVASAMCEHSQLEAVEIGYRAMQYNLVVSTNEGAVRLWKRHGFEVVGVLPGAFHHPRLGDVDALVMFKRLASG